MDEVGALEDRLILVARETFLRNGYGLTSINEIAKAARVSRNTVYARFPTKADLFRNIVQRQIAAFNLQSDPSSIRESDTLPDRMRAFANLALSISLRLDVLQLNRLIVSECHQFPELAEAAQERHRAGVAHVAQIIANFAKRDGLGYSDPTRTAEVFLLALQGWYTMAMMSNHEISARERHRVVDDIVDVLFASRAS
jgi:AcrR family transcriptional regulator